LLDAMYIADVAPAAGPLVIDTVLPQGATLA